MKVISGEFKGMNLSGHDLEGTRPTMDRVKESLFGMIQNSIKGSTCLDLFAGSGNLGIEAISEGAEFAYFNDLNKKATKVIRENIDKLSINGKCLVFNKDYFECLKQFAREGIKLDVIFLDPPYDLEVINDILKFIDDRDILNEGGIIVCEYNKLNLEIKYENFEEYKTKKYGDKFITIYKK